MSVETEEISISRRKLMVHDALTFLGLALVTVVLFGVTLLLFRSFAAHRDELARRWAGRGQAALTAGRPGDAIVALRTALSYAPDRREYELLLAQALGDAGHTEESYNYFMGLWETRPGDGFINLRLARLAAAKGDARDAEKYYRASMYGTWEGDATDRRRDVRLELARYLLGRHDNNGARTELMIAGGNTPGDPALAMRLAPMLEEAGAPADALAYYRRALAAEPRNEKALEAAGRLEFALGDFDEARRLLERSVRLHNTAGGETPAVDAGLLEKSERILELMPSRRLPSRVRVARIVAARALAKKRFDACSAEVTTLGESSSALQGLSSAWADKDSGALRMNEDVQDATVKLIFDTEIQTSEVCGAPSGDDALLLLMARSPKALDQ